MIEIIIIYFFVTAVAYSITRDKGGSFLWPITFGKFIFASIVKVIGSVRKVP